MRDSRIKHKWMTPDDAEHLAGCAFSLLPTDDGLYYSPQSVRKKPFPDFNPQKRRWYVEDDDGRTYTAADLIDA